MHWRQLHALRHPPHARQCGLSRYHLPGHFYHFIRCYFIQNLLEYAEGRLLLKRNNLYEKLNRPGLLEGGVGAVLFNSFETLHRDIHNNGCAELGDVDAAFLEVRLTADLAGRVTLRRAGAVRVPPADLRALPGNFTLPCHSGSMVTLRIAPDNYAHLPLSRRPHPLDRRARSRARLRRQLARRPDRAACGPPHPQSAPPYRPHGLGRYPGAPRLHAVAAPLRLGKARSL